MKMGKLSKQNKKTGKIKMVKIHTAQKETSQNIKARTKFCITAQSTNLTNDRIGIQNNSKSLN